MATRIFSSQAEADAYDLGALDTSTAYVMSVETLVLHLEEDAEALKDFEVDPVHMLRNLVLPALRDLATRRKRSGGGLLKRVPP